MKMQINFGPDKSQILRGIAIVFMIILHNHVSGLFKICVPIFTFLVGYGYAFAKEKNLRHAVKRSWHLLSHFWLILLGIFLPVGILAGGFNPTLSNVLPEMFGLDSRLNWYSWYVYFYIYAMLVMIPVSVFISRYKLSACFLLIAVSFAGVFAIHKFPFWSSNIYLQALHDCLLCSPVMFVGFYLAEGGGITSIRLKKSITAAVSCIIISAIIFVIRGIPYMTFFDFITVPLFCTAIVVFFNIIEWQSLSRVLICLGKESMNMWFFHALFATACTATVFAPLIMWIEPKMLLIATMTIVSYFAGRLLSSAYNKL